MENEDIKYLGYVSGFVFIGLLESYKMNFRVNFGIKRRMEKMFINTLYHGLLGILTYKVYPLGILYGMCKSIDLVVDTNDCLSSFRN